MKIIADICIIPLGVGLSLSEHIAACQEIFEEKDLKTVLHAYGTNVEGDWDDVMSALRQCHERLHALGAVRISTNMRLGTRTDREQSMQEKVASVKEKVGKGSGA